ncbi:hypothetical protein [Roseobacter fucihabitans]|uniref:hypothetical protein n=1 Tax=Roseobacter fucihabitans TaxID=1537242 RepID=UPI001652D745|nr:hypothetical protein [Roseobacter litoralis]
MVRIGREGLSAPAPFGRSPEDIFGKMKAHEFMADLSDDQILAGAQQAERLGWINLQAALD